MQLKKSTGLWVAGVGVAALGLGALIRGQMGSMIKGIGLAHIALGALDNFRQVFKEQ